MVLKEGATGPRGLHTPRRKFQVLRSSKIRCGAADWRSSRREPIPTKGAARFEYGTLGEYALTSATAT